MAPLTKQDVQNLLEVSRNRIFERIASHQDIQAMQETIKALCNINQQTLQLIRQGEYQKTQLIRRAVLVENRMTILEQELKSLRITLTRMIDSQPQQAVITAQPDQNVSADMQYTYRTT